LAHDSSIGGKVGVNLNQAKNLVGAFHHPLAVFYDVDALASLPSREWRGGMAEIIKHAVIGQEKLLRQLSVDPVLAFPGAERAQDIISKAASVKISVVARDEHESGLRMVLNYGHTVGHAIEKLSNYRVNHGEAVAMGMLVENHIAVQRNWLSQADEAEIREVLEKHQLSLDLSSFRFEEVVEILKFDKKHTGMQWTFALPKGIGTVQVAEDIQYNEVEAAWNHVTNWRKQT
jgi:3-dehydroquinate synthase